MSIENIGQRSITYNNDQLSIENMQTDVIDYSRNPRNSIENIGLWAITHNKNKPGIESRAQ